MITNILLVLVLLVVAASLFIRKKEGSDQVLESQKDKAIGELQVDLANEKTAKDQLSGKNKQLFVDITGLKAQNASLSKENEEFKARKESDEKELTRKIEKLEQAENALQEEKLRVRREDEEKLQREREERARMWAEHEEKVKVQLTEICKLPQYSFQFYDNNNLPVSFGGRFKPDFMIEFLGQYVIFDAKVSESDNLQNYIGSNVKSTVEKIDGNSKIYNTVFFVVPTEAISTLKTLRYYEKGYEFFVVSPEALESIFGAFKKINSYEIAQQLDPRDRENIVNLIAEFDYHINLRNALDILASESGVAVLKKATLLQADLKDEIDLKKSKMRLQTPSPTDVKTLLINPSSQEERITDLVSPKVAISADKIKTVKSVVKKSI